MDLFANDFYTNAYDTLGYFSYADFFEFDLKIGIQAKRLERIYEDFSAKSESVKLLISESYLAAEMKNTYLNQFQNRLIAYQYRF